MSEWRAEAGRKGGHALSELLARQADRLEPPERGYPWEPEPHQQVPDGDWSIWALIAGRGSGKTDAGANALNEHMQGPPCDERMPGGHAACIVAPTLGDAIESCVKPPAGVRAHNPDVKLLTTVGGTYLIWPNGAEAKLFGANTENDVERLRAGGNRCYRWLEELAAMRYMQEAWDQSEFGLRLGSRPRTVVTTTPKNRPLIRTLVARGASDPGVILVRASTFDNPHLETDRLDELLDRYEGTRLGRQELYGELITEVEGALWTPDGISDSRLAQAPSLRSILVGVDPSAWGPESGTKQEWNETIREGKGVETGIVVAGIGGCPSGWEGRCQHPTGRPHVYVLDDQSGRLPPAKWGERVVAAYHNWTARAVVPEVNMGGALVTNTVRSVDDSVRITPVRAKDAKRARAEPVAALWEQTRGHMVGTFPILEDQLTTWAADENWSPDRLDAMVWSITKLEPWKRGGSVRQSAAGRTVAPGPPTRRATPSGARVLPQYRQRGPR